MMMLRITHDQSVVAEILLKLQDSLQHKLLNHQLRTQSIMSHAMHSRALGPQQHLVHPGAG